MPVVIPLYTNLLHFRYASGERICAREPFIMSRTFRNLALSAALLAASTGSAFASAPGGTNPPPTGSYISIFLSFLGM